MQAIISIIGILGIFTLGFFLINAILGRKIHILERLSLGFLLGSGIFTFTLFILNWKLNIPFGKNQSLLILLFLNLISFFLDIFANKKRGEKKLLAYNFNFKEGFENANIWEKVGLGLILFLFLSSFLSNLYWPVHDWDALALYDFRAKVFLVEKSLVKAALDNDYFIHYPLLTSLLHLFIYQLGIANPKFVYSFFYLSFIFVFYFSLRSFTNRNKALFFSVLLGLNPFFVNHSMMAYTNLPYSVYLVAGVIYLYEWIKNKKLSTLILSSLLVGFSCWTRTEPFWVIPVLIVFVYSLIRKRPTASILYFFIVYFFHKIWHLFMDNTIFLKSIDSPSMSSVANYFDLAVKMIDINRIILVSSYLYKNVFSSWGVIFLAFLVILFMNIFITKNKKNFAFLFILFLFFALLYVGTLVFSITFPGWQEIPDSARRMSMFFIPLIIYYLGLSL
jgi:hypothetical protein